MLIRRERPGDEATVHEIHTLAFRGNGWGPVAEAVLVDLLRADQDAWLPRLSLVAEVDGSPVGHVVCSRARLGSELPVLGLGPLGVRPDHHGRGIGTALVHAACAAAEALDEPLVVLLGDPDFYSRTGFRPAADLGITPPDPAWKEHFQVRPLTGYDPAVHRGPFRYAPAFDHV